MPAKRQGISLVWLLGGAAVLGVAVGLGASFLREPPPEAELDDAVALVSRAMPMGEPTPADPMEPDPELLQNIPPYPKHFPRRMTTNGTILSAPFSLAWFHADESPVEVINHYKRSLADAGVMWAAHWYSPTMGYIGWMDNFDKITADGGRESPRMFMVSAMPQSGKTLVMLSKTFPEAMLSGAAPQLPEGLVLPNGASTPRIIEMGGEGSSRQAIYAQVPDGQVDTLERFYEAHMKTAGWDVDRMQNSPEHRALTGTRGDRRWSVVFQPKASGVDILMTHETRVGQ